MWFTTLENGLIYFHWSGYPKKGEFRKIGKELAKQLEAAPNSRLLIDMRRNGGGDFTKGRLLMDLIEESVKTNNIEVYTAIERNVYSAAVANAIDSRDQLGSTLIGGLTAGRPNGYQENNPFVLPKSKIPGSCSSELYVFQEEDTPGLFPEIEIPFTWNHFANGEDPVLEWLSRKQNQE